MTTRTDSVAAPHADYVLLASALTLAVLGLTMVFISSTAMAQHQYEASFYFVKRQGLYILLGLAVLYVGQRIPVLKSCKSRF